MATIEFVPLKDFENDYEILSQYPFTIRKKRNHYVISEWKDYKGYIKIKLNQKHYFKQKFTAVIIFQILFGKAEITGNEENCINEYFKQDV